MDTNCSGIAIIGMSGRFPGAGSVDRFWKNLVDGVEAISFFSDEELLASGVDVAALKKDPGYVAARSIVENPDLFDASFFSISSKEAEFIDPQQRLFLEASWEALEHAGYDPARTNGYVGVYAGMGGSSYYVNNVLSRPDLAAMRGKMALASGDKDYLATRVAYKLNLKGPALSISTACSTSLVSVCQACQALLCYQCDIAVAGGVSVTFPQKRAYYPEGGILSFDGHCRPFDALATGTNFSDGLGVVVLKRLAEAMKDGDEIYAVIKGFALNNDGSAKVGFAAPSVDGQAEVIALALAQAGIEPATISYVETHGTATPLGDPIEIAGLTKAFQAGTAKKNFCAIGSLKGNVGHMDAAAGVGGLIKTALALKHKTLPPSLNFTAPNPKINFSDSPFFVNTELRAWKAGETPRRAGVSAFGIGGTNAHVVLEEAPPASPSGPGRKSQLLVLSAKTKSALDAATANFCEHLRANPELNMADAAFTLHMGRHAFDHRRMLVCSDREDAVHALEENSSKRILTHEGKVRERSVVFMFPGQGAQYVNMGAELYRSERMFHEEVDRCAVILIPHLGFDLREVLFPVAEEASAAEELLIQTRITQPALFVLEYALAKLWISWGLRPSAMIGHSVGEFVAACLAGVFTLEEALQIVAARAQLVQAQPGGAMLAVRLPEMELASLLTDGLSIAAVNSPSLCVAAGPFEAVADLEERLEKQDVAARRLHTSHAFHSAMMDPVLQPLTQLLEKVRFQKPSIPYVSNVTGQWITDREVADPEYWARHVRQTVRFADGVSELLKDPEAILLEVGPGRTLCSLVSQRVAKGSNQMVVPSLSTPEGEVPSILTAVGKLWLTGKQVDWSAFYSDERRVRVALPTYPFERKRFWIEPPSRSAIPLGIGIAAAISKTDSSVEPMTMTNPLLDLTETSVADFTKEAPAAGSSAVSASRAQRILAMLTTEFQALSSADLTEVGPDASFMEMGLDSLFLGQAILAIEKRFGIRITFRQLLQETTTLNELAGYLDRNLPADALPLAASHPAAVLMKAPAADSGSTQIEAIQAQLQALAQQLEVLRRAASGATPTGPNATSEEVPALVTPQLVQTATTETPSGVARSAADAAEEEVLTLPLNEAQMELWLAAGADPEASCAYNQSLLIHLRGPISCEALRESVQELVDRHDALRTTFLPDGSGQQIVPTLQLHIPLRDLSSLSATEAQRKLDEVVALEDRTPFDLANGPLIRVQIVKVADDHHALIVAAHHIVLDGWSISVLLRELTKIYPAKLEGRSAGLEPAMQYRDYLEWQNLPENRARAAEAEMYWTRQFANPPAPAELPTDRPRPAVKTYRANGQSITLDSELYQSLKKAAAAQDCTMFTYLLASLNVWLHRLTGHDDLVIGIPAAGQLAVRSEKYQGSRSLVGHCVDLLPLRSRCAGELRFNDYLNEINRLVIDAYEHQDCTFGKLVKNLKLTRDAGRMPLIAVAFNFSRANRSLQLPDCEVVTPRKNFSFFDLMIEVQENKDNLRIESRFNSDLFDASTAGRWLHHLKALLEGMTRTPEKSISVLPLLTEGEAHQLLHEWNNTQTAFPIDKCIHQLFEEQVKRTPDATAVMLGNSSLTYRELNCRANQLAHRLRTLGVKPDARVAICVERSFEMVAGLMAILKAGGAYVPLDPAYPLERLRYMLADAQPIALLTHGQLNGLVDGRADTFPVIDLMKPDASWNSQPETNPDAEEIGIKPHHLAYVIYTSGSTGQPKGVMVEHRGLCNMVQAQIKSFAIEPDSRVLQFASLSFDASISEIGITLCQGAALYLVQQHELLGEELLRVVEKKRITHVTLPGAVLATLPEHAKLESIQTLIVAGDALPKELANCWARGRRLINAYGPTEASVCASLYECRANETVNPPIGSPIANTRIYILDSHRQPVPIGVAGEIYIGGAGVARGYLNRPELTAERFLPDPFVEEPEARMYRTGDLARWLTDGNIEYLGRSDFQVKIRGFRIELGEIESRLAEHSAIREAVVIAREDTPGNKRLIAYYTSAREQEAVGAEQLRSHLAASLPDYMVPVAYVRLEALPLTPNGKLDRKALPAPEIEAFSSRSYEPPQGEMETKLAEVWAEVLKVDRVGRHDNFFDLGGHSLLAVQLITRLQKIIPGEVLQLRAFLEAPTVERLAVWLENRQDPPAQILVKMREGNPANAPFFCAPFPDGTAMGMRPLAMALDPEIPFYCLQHKGLDGSTPFDNLDKAARFYVDEIRKVQPHGPYHLGGFCFGGVVAFAMACRFEELGEPVGALFLIDSFNPAYRRAEITGKRSSRLAKYYFRRLGLHLREMRLLRLEELLSYARGRIKAMYIQYKRSEQAAAKIKHNQLSADGNGAQAMPQARSQFEEFLAAMRRNSSIAQLRYAPQPYGGHANLIRTSDHTHDPFDDYLLGWEPLIRGSLQIFEIDCTHDDMTRDPAVRVIAQRINANLRDAALTRVPAELTR